MHNFVDLVDIEVESGSGGDGVIAWRKEKFIPHGGPAGGDGGRGGSVWIQSTNSLNTLLDFRFNSKFKAKDGDKGASCNRSGKSSKDLTIKVPIGTSIFQIKDNDELELIADLTKDNQTLLLAKGGRGGRGNQHFANSVKQAPHICEPGQLSVKLKLRLELKLVAHVGIIGLPNAGKSTLISKISACKPKIADYPFTTIVPNLGIVKLAENKSLTVADIPGLIEGASEGHGLGLQFLRHIERTKALIHLIDCSTFYEDSADTDSAEVCIKAYETIVNELKKYELTKSTNSSQPHIPQRQIVVLNKIDSVVFEELEKIKNSFTQKYQVEPLCISCITGEGLPTLLNKLLEIHDSFDFNASDINQEYEQEVSEQKLEEEKEKIYSIRFDQERGTFRIISPSIESWVRVTDFTNYDSINHLFKKLKKINFIEELEEFGVKSGDTVFIGKREMIWSDMADIEI